MSIRIRLSKNITITLPGLPVSAMYEIFWHLPDGASQVDITTGTELENTKQQIIAVGGVITSCRLRHFVDGADKDKYDML